MSKKKDEALKLALEAFEADASNENFLILKHRVREALAEQPAQKTCLVANESCKHGSWCSEVYCQEHCKFAQPAQEPVALEAVYETIIHWDEGGGKRSRRELARRIVALYTSPPASKPWVGLTEAEHTQIAVECGCMSADWVFYGAAVERKLREKNA